MQQTQHQQLARELLLGAYDLHTHPWPSHVARAMDDDALFREAEAWGMAGVVLKNHYEPTGARAALLNRRNAGSATLAYGSVTLNWPLGGLNPYAMESALRLGARMVWFPTRDSAYSLRCGDMPGDFFSRPGLSALDGEGRLKPEVSDLFDLAVQYNVPLATGHLSMPESAALCKAGRARGVRMILTHPEWRRTVAPLEFQQEMAALGVMIEKCWLNLREGDCSEAYMMHTIRSLGAGAVFLSTDCGLVQFEPPVAGMADFLERLLANGFSVEEIRAMSAANPAALLGL